MIEVFKIISNIYDDKVTTNILTMRLNNFFFFFFIYKFYSEICTKVLTTIDHIAFGVCKNHS